MIARTTAGRSFKGTALYVLHDKDRAKTSDRVAFAETVNLPTSDPKRAVAHMIDTATHAEQLKKAAGVRAGGRPLAKPVYHYTLAWHPTEAPDQAEQIEAARSSMAALGLEDRQALIVAHTDTKHPHVHVIVNRVCPKTGKAASLGNDRLKLSEWAEAYERERGQVFCHARSENQAERAKGQWVKATDPPRHVYEEWKKTQTKALWDEHRQDRQVAREDRRGQFDALWRQKEERFQARRAEIKALWKPKWRETFERQRAALAAYDGSLRERLRFAMTLKGSKALNALRAVIGDQGNRQLFVQAQALERKDMGKVQTQTIRDAGREVTKAWRYDRDQLKALHAQQDAHALAETKARATAIQNAPTPAKDRTKPEFTQTADRRKPENTVARSSLEAFYGDDKAALEKARARKQARADRKKRERKRRPRDRGGRTMDR